MNWALRGLPSAGGVSPGILRIGRRGCRISIFVDGSGADGLDSNYYLLTLVLHEQERPIDSAIEPYERALGDKRLPNIPFHMSPLLNGHDEYEGMSSSSRASLLSSFMLLFHHLPIRYKTFSYRKREFSSASCLSERMRRDVVNFLFDNLEYLRRFDLVKVYYDGGQHAVTQAHHDAVEYAIAREAVVTYNFLRTLTAE